MLEIDPRGGFVHDLAIVALIVILFRDGLEVEAEMLQNAWRLPLRKLVVAMPLTCVIVALAAHALTDLGWTECFLLGALLSPTDPVLSSSVVTNPRVPRVVRHSLNLESGLNDGLALPAVLAFLAVAAGQDDFVWWQFVLQDVTLGFAFGIAMGLLAAALMPRSTRDPGAPAVAVRARRRVRDLRRHGRAAAGGQRADRGVRVRDHARHPPPRPAPDVRGARRRHRRDRQARRVRRLRLAAHARRAVRRRLGRRGDRRVTLLIARPAAIAVALLGTKLPFYLQAFMAWFGPKGVATMTFSLLVLGEGFAGAERIFNLAALCVFASILAHGLTDTPGSRTGCATRAERPAPGR